MFTTHFPTHNSDEKYFFNKDYLSEKLRKIYLFKLHFSFMKTSIPYIGVTGLTSKDEVKQVVSLFEENPFSFHIPMLGFLVSYKTLNHLPTENKRYPKMEDLPGLLMSLKGKKVFPTIHYNSREKGLFNQVSSIFGSGIYQEKLCLGLQLNIPWPDLNELKVIKSVYPELKIIFQASKEVTSSEPIDYIADRLSSYSPFLDYVLLDPSAGKGLEFDLDLSYKIYQEIKGKSPNLTIGFAGGLTGENVFSRIKSLEKALGTSEFSFDSERRIARQNFLNLWG